MGLTLRCYFMPSKIARTWSLLDSRKKGLQEYWRENFQPGIYEKEAIWLDSRMYYKIDA